MTIRLVLAIVALLALPGCIVTPAAAQPAPADPPPEEAHPDRGYERAQPAPPPRERARSRRPEPRRAAPPTTRPAPRPRPPSERPEPPVEACAQDAAVVYAETTRSLPAPGETKRRFVVRESGSWSVTENGETRRGCLKGDELAELEAALAAASFDPPPPPEVTCMAMPTERIVYEDVAGGRRALIERPCGRQSLNPKVGELSRLAASLTTERADAGEPEAELPSRCDERAPKLVSASVAPLGRPSPRRASTDTRVRVAKTGSWVRWEGEAVTCGRLPRRELQRLRVELRRADLGTVEQPIACRARPTTEYRVTTSGERTAWQTPCGSAAPTDDAQSLAESILSIGS